MKDTTFLDSFKFTLVEDSYLECQTFNFLNKLNFSKIYQHHLAVVSRGQLVKLLILFRLLSLRSICDSIKGRYAVLLPFGKDVLYSFVNSDKINWRSVLYQQVIGLIDRIEINRNANISREVPCLIIDDTDMNKVGICIEWIGRIYSHVTGKHSLGFKSLNLAYWTGKNIFQLDFSLHAEMGKKGNQGLTNKQQKKRFSRIRERNSHGYKRERELFEKKTDAALEMIKKALTKNLIFKYILFDSWFFSGKAAQVISKLDALFISRPKRNNWQYFHKNKYYTISDLIKKYKGSKQRDYSRKLQMYYVEIPVEFKGNQLKIILFKSKIRGTKWRSLITNHMALSAIKAYEIYQNRWAIEVSFKDMKQNMQFGKCQSRDFTGQIAHATISLLTYNTLSVLKTVNEHQSIGALFDETRANQMTPTMMELFWNTVFKFINKLAILCKLSVDYLLEQITQGNELLGFLSENRRIFTTET